MIYLTGVCLNSNENARIIKCKDGIPHLGEFVCNLSQNNTPYYQLHFMEVVDGQTINTGYIIIWGKLTSSNEVRWRSWDIGLYLKAIEKGPISTVLLFALLKYSGSPRFWEQDLQEGEESFFNGIKEFHPSFNRNEMFGEFVRRAVAPYRDSNYVIQNEYTCFIFNGESKCEDRIKKEFAYQGHPLAYEQMSA